MWAVVVAGGTGTRFGGLKQFAPLGGRPVVSWAVEACRTVADGVVLVLPPSADRSDDGTDDRTDDRAAYGADVVVAGGATRSESVRRGLDGLPGSVDIVVVHDAARPLATAESFRAVVGALADGRAGGAICALPAADTLKRTDRPLGPGDEPTTVTETLDRSHVVIVQTPQAFPVSVLRQAHQAAPEATDDAALVEALGLAVRVVPGHARNLKLATPEDLAYAEQVLGR